MRAHGKVGNQQIPRSAFQNIHSLHPPGVNEPLAMWSSRLVLCHADRPAPHLAGGIYQIRIQFPDQYPEKPPRVRFITEMFHPNSESSCAVTAGTHG